MLKDILSLRNNDMFDNFLGNHCWRWEVGNGELILFWHDIWTGERSLKLEFPRLFSLCINHSISLAEMICWAQINDSPRAPGLWRRPLRGWECVAESDMFTIVRSFSVKSGGDEVKWSNSPGLYTVKDAYSVLLGSSSSNIVWRRIWSVRVAPKVKILLWKIAHNIVPTKWLLITRIKKGDGICEVCKNDVETVSHLFWGCPLVSLLWSRVFCWWNLQIAPAECTWHSLMMLFDRVHDTTLKPAWEITVAASLWVIWLSRNDTTFRNCRTKAEDRFSLVKLRAFEWCVLAGIVPHHSFMQWCKNPALNSAQFMAHKKDLLLAHSFKKYEVVVFTDGAFSPKSSGVGGLFLDSNLNILYVFSGPSKATSSLFAEYEAFMLACRVIQRHWQNFKVLICLDSSIVVSQFLRYKSGLGGIEHSPMDFSVFGLEYDTIWAQHINRALNSEADYLAKSGASRVDLVAGKPRQ